MTHPSLDSDPLLGLEVEKIFGVELKVSLGRAYYNAGEMGDMRPTWHDDASLAQSHRGEEGRKARVLRMGAQTRGAISIPYTKLSWMKIHRNML